MSVTIFVDGVQQSLTDAQWAEIAPEEMPASAYTLYKTDVTGRMSDEELAVFDGALVEATVRERRLWADCTRLVSDDPYFSALHERFVQAFGQERADAILAA